MQKIVEEAREMQEELVQMRRYLHRNPEVGLELPVTKAFVMEQLRRMGITPVEVGTSGVSALLGQGNKTILLRADMDALPAREAGSCSFSADNGNGHLCGHDLHAACLLGAAKILKRHEGELKGCVKLMFQPAEETGKGAQEMIQAGIMENPPVDAAIALHVNPEIPVGRAGYRKGFMSSSLDAFLIHIQGKGGHGSTPEMTVSPIAIASHMELMLESLVQREIGAFEPVVLTTGKLGGGNLANVIPDTAVVEMTSRCYNSNIREFIDQRVHEIAEHVCAALRGSCTIQHTGCPSVFVAESVMDTVKVVLDAVLGEECVEEIPHPFTGSEDFSYISEQVPSAFFWMGAGDGQTTYPLHNPNVVFHEGVLWRGAAIMASSAMAWLNEEFRKQ
ncbi:MAG: M20 family metallopeptidase [Eubacteriales bacterium]|nr:M20 family metallopeptidase [Eubacteriales bacterium]